jgi:hypothetical protein
MAKKKGGKKYSTKPRAVKKATKAAKRRIVRSGGGPKGPGRGRPGMMSPGPGTEGSGHGKP